MDRSEWWRTGLVVWVRRKNVVSTGNAKTGSLTAVWPTPCLRSTCAGKATWAPQELRVVLHGLALRVNHRGKVPFRSQP